MTGGALVGVERQVAASPVWLHLVDTFTARAPEGPVEVTLARRGTAGTWLPIDVPYQLKPTGDLAFLNLGRTAPGGAGQTFDVRIALRAPRLVVETSAGGDSVDATITTWNADHPVPPAPRDDVRCYPAPDYRYPPEIPVHPGRVVDSAGNPVARARVTATETVLGAPVVEEVRTDDDGWFRLPLRWSSGSTTIDADRLGASGATTINLPADLRSASVITIA
jgi:Carboxypeptidase regulatory-like domain